MSFNGAPGSFPARAGTIDFEPAEGAIESGANGLTHKREPHSPSTLHTFELARDPIARRAQQSLTMMEEQEPRMSAVLSRG